ncbi:hemerythrin domain-containing protein [Vogesella oryzae]|uniref:hemerythrin domain-containing protein n=1 Tax=Vogesella oryzae TaxID=1735285 RepID=UPI001581F09E|nr:hemerythrin domain-containing protein [Vogesella oryzae]
MTLTRCFTQVHRACDDQFVAVENALRDGDWPQVVASCDAFCQAMTQHFAEEENVLFPAFEQATGMSQGPTVVMRHEHAEMRQLMDEMCSAAATLDGDALAGAADTLLLLMQQHNLKEENILYPMCDRVGDMNALLAELGHEPA